MVDHVGLPHVLDLTVHLLNWMARRDHSKTILLKVFFLLEHSFIFKSYRWVVVGRWVGWVVAHVILVSAPVPIGPFDLVLLWVRDWNNKQFPSFRCKKEPNKEVFLSSLRKNMTQKLVWKILYLLYKTTKKH